MRPHCLIGKRKPVRSRTFCRSAQCQPHLLALTGRAGRRSLRSVALEVFGARNTNNHNDWQYLISSREGPACAVFRYYEGPACAVMPRRPGAGMRWSFPRRQREAWEPCHIFVVGRMDRGAETRPGRSGSGWCGIWAPGAKEHGNQQTRRNLLKLVVSAHPVISRRGVILGSVPKCSLDVLGPGLPPQVRIPHAPWAESRESRQWKQAQHGGTTTVDTAAAILVSAPSTEQQTCA